MEITPGEVKELLDMIKDLANAIDNIDGEYADTWAAGLISGKAEDLLNRYRYYDSH